MHRAQITSFVDAVVFVYIGMIIVYIVMQMLPLPYNRWLVRLRDFLDQTVRPYLNLFRRYVPPLGPIDISPMLAVLLIVVGRQVLLNVAGI
jgi:YggT family protein